MRPRLRVLPLVLCLSAPVLGASAASAAEGPVPVVFGCSADAPSVCRVDVDGGGEQVRVLSAADSSAQWSPDGLRLAFTAAGQVVTTDGDGGDRRVEAAGSFGAPRWSPDGTRLSLTGTGDQQGLWVLDLRTGGLLRLEDRPSSAGLWAPDGSALVTLVTVPVPERDYSEQRVLVLAADGASRRDLGTPDPSTRAGQLGGFSPDGRLIATGGSAVRLLRVDGSGAQLLLANAGGAQRDREGVTDWVDLAWSPDGSELAFAYDTFVPDTQSGYSGLGAVRLDGSGSRLLTRVDGSDDAFTGEHPDWSAGGGRLVYNAQVTGGQDLGREVAVVGADGSGARTVTSGQRAVAPDAPALQRRLAGRSRYDTAVSVSRSTFARAASVVVARGDAFPDALAAAPLASSVEGPLLLSAPAGAAQGVVDEVRRLGATTAYLVGDESALSPRVEADLRLAGVIEVVRLGGRDRYETAARVARQVGGQQPFLASGRTAVDAAAVTALASRTGQPVLLTDPARLSPATAQALAELQADRVVVVGGEAAVSPDVAEQAGRGRQLERLAGADRWATSAAVADRSLAAGLSAQDVWLATGRDYPDALAGGAAAAAAGSVLLLVDPRDLDASPASAAWLARQSAAVRRVTALGGPDVLSPSVVVRPLS